MKSLTLVFSLLLASIAGCGPFRLTETPEGFAEVSSGDDFLRMKSQEDVGLAISTFDNVRGGTLAFWSEDLVSKLGERGYALRGQSAAQSKNGVVGTRFDFVYLPPGMEIEKFYTVLLFVSDAHRVVVQFAGNSSEASKQEQAIGMVAGELRVRGCKTPTKACRGPQPAQLKTALPETTAALEVTAQPPGPNSSDKPPPASTPPATL